MLSPFLLHDIYIKKYHMKTAQEYNEDIDILTRRLSYEDDPNKKKDLSVKLQKKKLEKEISIIRDKINKLG